MRVLDPYPPVPPPGQDDLPYSDGEPMETPRHRRQMNLLIESLAHAWRGREDLFIGGDMFVYYSMLQTKQSDFRGPDVFVVLGAIPERERERKSWVVWEENGKLPDVVIELTSPTTVRVDRGEKKRVYEQVWHLPEYFLFDPWEKTFEGWRLVDSVYVAIEPRSNGDLESRVLGLRVGVREGTHQDDTTTWLRWIDPATGHVLPSGEEMAETATARADEAAARAQKAAARAEEAAARAEEATARADALAAEIAELRKRMPPERP